MFERKWMFLSGVLLVACGAGGVDEEAPLSSEWIDVDAVEEGGGVEGAEASDIGQLEQGLIDESSPVGCFAAVPPFTFASDVISLGVSTPFIPSSTCGAGGAQKFFLIENFAFEFSGNPVATPAVPAPQTCADLVLSFSVGRSNGVNRVPTIVSRGSQRGVVVVQDGVALCSLALPIGQITRDFTGMRSGNDYLIAVQLLRDGSDGQTEQVLISPGRTPATF